MALKQIPDGFHAVTPSLIVDDAAAAIDFYCRALGASELYRLPMQGPDGRDIIGHAEIRIGDSVVMLSDEWPDMQLVGPKARGGSSVTLMVYVEDVDGTLQRALDAGATPDRPVEDQFWGDRTGSVFDPFGHRWMIATRVEDVPQEELQQRMKAWSQSQSG